MRWNWLPWKTILRFVAWRGGFIDPLMVFARLQRFAQPSEVAAPLELVRAGILFHARGLVNTRAIQQNLDWVWPFWAARQFDPRDPAFLPRAFSLTHVNLTHRSWTACGRPGLASYPIVDPRGVVTPFFDGWSLDAWVVDEQGNALVPAWRPRADQRAFLEGEHLVVDTRLEHDGLRLQSRAFVTGPDERPLCRLEYLARADRPAWLALALRPTNPEGVAFVHRIEADRNRNAWRVDGEPLVRFKAPLERHRASRYRDGDVHQDLLDRPAEDKTSCEVGMATAAALFALDPATDREIALEVDLSRDPAFARPSRGASRTWPAALAGAARLSIPDERFRSLWEASLRTLVLFSPRDVYPGPYTYKRFWFRDAAIMLHALACAGLARHAEAPLASFEKRQTLSGYFHSQYGEWDANGQVLWLMGRWRALTGALPRAPSLASVRKAASWIVRKRLKDDPDSPQGGLLPAGFSAEHLGPNDYYFWDDFWSVAGLRAAADLLETERPAKARRFREEADDLLRAVERSLEATFRKGPPVMPASPTRRPDAASVGSLAAGYPLALFGPEDPRLVATARHLRDHHFFEGAFFHDVQHAGINPYLSLHIAQVLLAAGDPSWEGIVRRVARLASPTGQWPEAIHPATGGGCMGDGQHGWASAEWVMMMRFLFVLEAGGRLVLGAGLVPSWTGEGSRLRFGPAPTPQGDIEVRVEGGADEARVGWSGEWRTPPVALEIRLPGFAPLEIPGAPEEGERTVRRTPEASLRGATGAFQRKER